MEIKGEIVQIIKEKDKRNYVLPRHILETEGDMICLIDKDKHKNTPGFLVTLIHGIDHTVMVKNNCFLVGDTVKFRVSDIIRPTGTYMFEEELFDEV